MEDVNFGEDCVMQKIRVKVPLIFHINLWEMSKKDHAIKYL